MRRNELWLWVMAVGWAVSGVLSMLASVGWHRTVTDALWAEYRAVVQWETAALMESSAWGALIETGCPGSDDCPVWEAGRRAADDRAATAARQRARLEGEIMAHTGQEVD